MTKTLLRKKAKFWTDKGLETLGSLIRQSRGEVSLREMSRLIEEATGFSVSASSLGDLENGTKSPKWNTLVVIAATGFVRHPITGRLLSVEDLSNIASETLDISMSDGVLAKLIAQQLEKFSIAQLAQLARVERSAISRALQGELPDDPNDLLDLLDGLYKYLINPDTQQPFIDTDDLAQYCNIVVPVENAPRTEQEERIKEHTLPGS